MPLEIAQRLLARGRIALGVELEPVDRRGVAIAGPAEQRPGLREREVDVEEDGAEGTAQYATGRRFASDGRKLLIERMRSRSRSATITQSSSGAVASTVPQGSTITERP